MYHTHTRSSLVPRSFPPNTHRLRQRRLHTNQAAVPALGAICLRGAIGVKSPQRDQQQVPHRSTYMKPQLEPHAPLSRRRLAAVQHAKSPRVSVTASPDCGTTLWNQHRSGTLEDARVIKARTLDDEDSREVGVERPLREGPTGLAAYCRGRHSVRRFTQGLGGLGRLWGR